MESTTGEKEKLLLASKLKEFLQDKKTREYMGRNARNHVAKNFSWQIIAEIALKCYRSLIEVSLSNRSL